ncbi:MAG: ArsR family transcriptional regulator [Dehalococcoidia bacterium]|nr:ArsR family transcriptional regulator [Dehalococcoidia bacterium]
MQGTRDRVLELIVERREVRVEELAEELGITAAAVRRHLDNLRADGLVDVRSVRQHTGRPFHAYYPTERAMGATGYTGLLERMLEGLSERQDVVAEVSGRMAESVASKHRHELADIPPELRVIQVTESLRQEGILERWHREGEAIHLVNGCCPYRKAAEISNLPCESDRKAIELLLGQDVEQVHRIVDGAPVCEYIVRTDRAPNDTIDVN